MTTISLLPPAYLLPAWTHGQLALFSFKVAHRCHGKHFSSYRAFRETDHPSLLRDENPESPELPDDHGRRHTVQSYAYRRENRYERSNEEIKRRLLGGIGGSIRKTMSASRKVERCHEAHLIKSYIEKQSADLSKPVKSVSLARGLPFDSNSLKGFQDLRDEEGDVPVASYQEIQPAPPGSKSFESLDSGLYPSSKRIKVVAQLEPTAASGVDSSRSTENHISGEIAAKEINGQPAAPTSSSTDISQTTDMNDARRSFTRAKINNKPQKSLLEELFPEEVAKHKTAQEVHQSDSRHAEPRELALPAVDDLQDDTILNRPRVLARNVITTSNHPPKSVPTLLVLENAVPNLVEADFKRISPKGKHIQEWKSMFDPSAIIPARTTTTAECTGKYFLVFRNLGHAKAWRSRVELLHRIARLNAANSITAPLIPKKGFSSHGEDIGETLREYSIFSHGVEPLIRLHSAPHADPTLKDELKMILARLKPSDSLFQAGRSVVLWIDGWTVGTQHVIRRMLMIDGRTRNMPWGDSGYSNIIEDYHNQIPLVRDKDLDPTSSPATGPKKWLITLRDEAEARRFVRAWHMRPFPAWLNYKKDEHDEPWPLVRTELVW